MDYFMFFRIDRILFLLEKWILQVEFSNWREGSGKPREAIVKIVINPRSKYQEQDFILKAQKLHPIFLVSYKSMVEGNFLIMIMEFCERGSLKTYLKKEQNRFWTEEQFVYNMKKVAKALKILHENKIAHRDIKPHNIFVTIEGILKVSDFGISKIINENEKHTKIGTRTYKSPQLFQNSCEPDPFKDDIWAFGISFAELALAKFKYAKYDQDYILKNYKSSEYSNQVKDILEMCLQENYSHRIDSKALYEILKNYSKILFKRKAAEKLVFTEEDYFNIINNCCYDANLRFNKEVMFNLAKIKNENLCVICKSGENLSRFRHVHKVHTKCLLNKLDSLLKDDVSVDCWICERLSKVENEKKIPQTLVQSLQFTTCQNESLSLNGGYNKCKHIFLMLGSTFMSKMYFCSKSNKNICSMCAQTSDHFHCKGLALFYKSYLSSVILSKSVNTEIRKQIYDVNEKKTGKKYGKPLKKVYVLKKTNHINTSVFRLQAFASLVSEYVLQLYFWYIESDYAYLYFEYADGKTLLNEVLYRKNRRIIFSNQEIKTIITNLISAVHALHDNRIYICSLKLKDIFIVEGKFKIANFSQCVFEEKKENKMLEEKDWIEVKDVINEVILSELGKVDLDRTISEWNWIVPFIDSSPSDMKVMEIVSILNEFCD